MSIENEFDYQDAEMNIWAEENELVSEKNEGNIIFFKNRENEDFEICVTGQNDYNFEEHAKVRLSLKKVQMVALFKSLEKFQEKFIN